MEVCPAFIAAPELVNTLVCARTEELKSHVPVCTMEFNPIKARSFTSFGAGDVRMDELINLLGCIFFHFDAIDDGGDAGRSCWGKSLNFVWDRFAARVVQLHKRFGPAVVNSRGKLG